MSVTEATTVASSEKALYSDPDKTSNNCSSSLFNFGGARVQDYLNTLSQIQQLQERGGGCSSSGSSINSSLSDNNGCNKMSTSSSSPSYSPKLYSSHQNNQQKLSRTGSNNMTTVNNSIQLPFSPEQTIKIINCSSPSLSTSGGSSSNDSSNSSSRSGSSSNNMLSSNTGLIMEGIRGVSYHHLSSSASTTATGASSKYRLPSHYPSSSCPGSNNSSISSPYSPSSQLNLLPPHTSVTTSSGMISVASGNHAENLRNSPPSSLAIDVAGPNAITTRPPSCSPVDLTSKLTKSSSSTEQNQFENIRISRNSIDKSSMDITDTNPLTTTTVRKGGPLTRSRKRKLGEDPNPPSQVHLNMPTAKNASVTITLQVNSPSSTSSSTSLNNEMEEMDSNPIVTATDTAQIVPSSRANVPKLQRRGFPRSGKDEVAICRLGIGQQNSHPALSMMSSNLSSQSFWGSSDGANNPTTTTAHAALAVLAATDDVRISGVGSSDDHIQNIRSAFASMPTSITASAATAGGVNLGCRGNSAVTITID